MKYISSFLKDKYIWILIVFYLAVVVGLPRNSYFADNATWTQWVNYIHTDGLLNIYQYPEVNYFPPILYLLRIFSSLVTSMEELASQMYLFKAFILVFDMASVYLVLKILRNFKIQDDWIFFLLFNIAFLYNTLFWGQVDGVYSFFLLWSIYMAYKKKILFSVLLIVTAVTIKLQAIIFLPLLFLLYVPEFKKSPLLILKSLLLSLLTEVVLLFPFLVAGKLPEIIRVAFSSVDFFPYISMNAYNYWVLILGYENTSWTSDKQLLLNISFKEWGLILFIVSSIFALLPLSLKILRELKGNYLKRSLHDFRIIILTAALIVMNFFLFNTQMHERYLHAAVLLFAVYAFLTKRYLIYFFFSLGYFLNLESILRQTGLSSDLFFLRPSFIAAIFMVVLVQGYIYLYEDLYSKNEQIMVKT